jgi:hypothetical protein
VRLLRLASSPAYTRSGRGIGERSPVQPQMIWLPPQAQHHERQHGAGACQRGVRACACRGRTAPLGLRFLGSVLGVCHLCVIRQHTHHLIAQACGVLPEV